jgi:hypothetical protein
VKTKKPPNPNPRSREETPRFAFGLLDGWLDGWMDGWMLPKTKGRKDIGKKGTKETNHLRTACLLGVCLFKNACVSGVVRIILVVGLSTVTNCIRIFLDRLGSTEVAK